MPNYYKPMKKILSTALVLCIALCASGQCKDCCSNCNNCTDYKVESRGFLYDAPVPPTCHAVTMVETLSGDILAAFFGGSYEGHPDSDIWLCRLDKDSDKWTEPTILAEGILSEYTMKAFDYDTLKLEIGKTRKPCYNPVLYQAASGDIVLNYKIGKNMQDWTGWEIRSSDNGRTWTNPRPLTTNPEERHLHLGPIKNKPFINNNRIIAGSSTEVTYDSWMVHFELSDDDGNTWYKVPVECDTILCIQPSILNLGNNHLKALCRTRQNHIAVTESFDNGSSWTPMQLSNLPNNDSGIDAVTLKNGTHLLICNDSNKNGKRSPLTLFGSKDSNHWYKIMDLEADDGMEYSYPAIIETHNGDVWIMYTWHRKKIAFAKLKL